MADPYGRKIAWKGQSSGALARLLADPRFAVRDRAATLLVHQGDPVLPALRGLLRHDSRQVRTQIVWVLARMASDGARAAIRHAMRDRDAGVRLAAVTAAGLNRDSRAFDRLRELVQSGTPPVRREAATALGRLDRTEAVPALLNALRNDPDRFLEHALIFAMIRLGDRRATQAGLDDLDPSVRRGCLIALDQMSRGRLTLDLVRPMLDAPEPAVREEALRVAARHPEWAARMAGLLRGWLAGDKDENGTSPADFSQQLLAFSSDPGIQVVIAEALERETTPVSRRIRLLEVMAAAQVGTWPTPWVDALKKALGDRDEQVVRQAVSVVLAVQPN